MNDMKIGFIGQGFVGKAYADDFASRGFDIVRYAKEEPYIKNKADIALCDIVFIAVPTPTTTNGFDDHILRDVLSLVGKGKVAVIKSTIVPGRTKELQALYPDIIVLHSPEFLTEKTAKEDATHPARNIIGIPAESVLHKEAAQKVLQTLPKAPYELICSSDEAEVIKYGGNCWFYVKVVYINMLYDLAKSRGLDWSTIEHGMAADPRIGSSHLHPEHQGGRGAGGHCFIKDFAALAECYEKEFPGDTRANALFDALAQKNNELLRNSGKDIDLLEGVYGKGMQ